MSTQIQEITKEIDFWRSKKKIPQEHMPKDLRNKILNFQEHQSDREMIRLFKLNNNFFNRRKSNKKSQPLKSTSFKGGFVKLPQIQATKKLKLSISLPNGVSMDFFE